MYYKDWQGLYLQSKSRVHVCVQVSLYAHTCVHDSSGCCWWLQTQQPAKWYRPKCAAIIHFGQK